VLNVFHDHRASRYHDDCSVRRRSVFDVYREFVWTVHRHRRRSVVIFAADLDAGLHFALLRLCEIRMPVP